MDVAPAVDVIVNVISGVALVLTRGEEDIDEETDCESDVSGDADSDGVSET
jgi:hypothetical protein